MSQLQMVWWSASPPETTCACSVAQFWRGCPPIECHGPLCRGTWWRIGWPYPTRRPGPPRSSQSSKHPTPAQANPPGKAQPRWPRSVAFRHRLLSTGCRSKKLPFLGRWSELQRPKLQWSPIANRHNCCSVDWWYSEVSCSKPHLTTAANFRLKPDADGCASHLAGCAWSWWPGSGERMERWPSRLGFESLPSNPWTRTSRHKWDWSLSTLGCGVCFALVTTGIQATLNMPPMRSIHFKFRTLGTWSPYFHPYSVTSSLRLSWHEWHLHLRVQGLLRLLPIFGLQDLLMLQGLLRFLRPHRRWVRLVARTLPARRGRRDLPRLHGGHGGHGTAVAVQGHLTFRDLVKGKKNERETEKIGKEKVNSISG